MDYKKYERAGEIGARVREWSKRLVKPGAKVLDIAESVEMKIREMGGDIAFPCNVSLNDVAAHYTPSAGDELTLGEKDVVTVDLGAHIDGYISDTAYTIDLSGEHGKLVEASEAALEAAISVIRDGIKVSKIGEAIEQEIKSRGFRPIENLTGHQLKQYELHAGISIPNIPVPSNKKLEEGQVFAIEPFATTGRGRVGEGGITEIYSYIKTVPIRMQEGRKILEVGRERRGLPFPARWFGNLNGFKVKMALRELTERSALHGYPILREVTGGLVTQTEHTMIVERDGCRVTTK